MQTYQGSSVYSRLKKSLKEEGLDEYIPMIQVIKDNILPLNVLCDKDDVKDEEIHRPRFCDSYLNFSDMPIELDISIDIQRKIGINCGLSRSEVMTFDDPDDLRLYLWNKGYVSKYTKNPELMPPQIYEPPFR